MATTDTNVPQVIVNKLTSAEYATATKSPTEFYAVTDEQIGTSDIANGAITSAKIASGALLDLVYPIGSIYMSATLSTPSAVATALGGGTWVAWGTGRVPVGIDTSDTDFNTVEKTGGSKDLQQHNHGLPMTDIAYYVGDNSGQTDFYGASSSRGCQFGPGYTNDAGTGQSGNLQPYITCYMYKRTA